MSELIDLDEAMVELAHILTPYDHDYWGQRVFYDKPNTAFLIRYRAYTVKEIDGYDAKNYTDSVSISIGFSKAMLLLKKHGSNAFYDGDLKQVKHEN